MTTLRIRWFLVCSLLLMTVAPSVHAAMAVFDVRAIAELGRQVQTMREQLTTARNQLTQSQREFQAITGGRGMQQLLAGTVRNYLPPDWVALEAAIRQKSATYQGLAANIQAAISVNALMSPQQLARLSAQEREQLEAARRSAAMLQVTARQALQTTSSRFAAIQQLIDAIPTAQDQKAILDLQTRIAAEQGMLVNEQTKLDVLYQAAQAEEWTRRQRTREQAITNVGSLRRLPAMGL